MLLTQRICLGRFRSAFATWKQAVSDVVVHEVYRVMYLLANTKELAPMVSATACLLVIDHLLRDTKDTACKAAHWSVHTQLCSWHLFAPVCNDQ